MNVTENITINSQGTNNTGFKRLIPIINDVQIRNVKINQIVGNEIKDVYYKVFFDKYNLILGIGDDKNKYGEIESYSINYEFRILNKTVEQNSTIKLNAIGNKWKCNIYNSNVKLIVPSSFVNAQCFIGNTKYKNFTIDSTENNKKIISASFKLLKNHQGVRFNLYFQPGSIKSYVDNYCYQYIIKSGAILIIIIGMSLIINYKNKINPIHYTPEHKTMDPLMMSKILYGSVNKPDITSIIFYWASKGFIDINIENEQNPILIRKIDSLPVSYPSYQIYIFNELFKNENEVHLFTLKFSFYKIINRIIEKVNEETKRRINIYSVILSLVFATFGSIWTSVAPMSISNMISQKVPIDYYYYYYYIIIFYIIWGIKYYMIFKYKIDNYSIFWFNLVLPIIFAGDFYMKSIPNFIINNTYKASLFIIGLLSTICSVSLIIKSEYFKEKINEIYGIKEFIKKPIDNEFQSLLKNVPELFYNVICYAQVLDLVNEWKNKFDKNQSASLPKYIKYSSVDDDYYNNYDSIFLLFNRMKTCLLINLIDAPKKNVNGNDIDYDHDYDQGGNDFSGDGFGGGGGYGD